MMENVGLYSSHHLLALYICKASTPVIFWWFSDGPFPNVDPNVGCSGFLSFWENYLFLRCMTKFWWGLDVKLSAGYAVWVPYYHLSCDVATVDIRSSRSIIDSAYRYMVTVNLLAWKPTYWHFLTPTNKTSNKNILNTAYPVSRVLLGNHYILLNY